MRKRPLYFALATALVCASAISATVPDHDDAKDPSTTAAAAPEKRCIPRRRLDFHEPLSAVYQFTQDDESALRLHYSFRYTPWCDYVHSTYRQEVFASYTGEFDFYMVTRKSGPVINRISNPALHYRRWIGPKLRYVDAAIEHRSDGQVANARELAPDGRLRAQVAYDNGEHTYFDSVSQDTNFFSVETRYDFGDAWRLWARAKPVYFANKTDITWGPLAERNPPIWQYERFRFILARKLGTGGASLADQTWVYAECTVGTRLFQTDSLNLSGHFPFELFGLKIPFYAKVHFGPLHTLSNYPKSQTSVGLGFLFLH